MRLSNKQRDLLLVLGCYGDLDDFEPMTNFALFNCAQCMWEDMEVDDSEEGWDWVDWSREAVREIMCKLEARGLVYRTDPPKDEGNVVPVGIVFTPPVRGKARYAWSLTPAGKQTVLELA